MSASDAHACACVENPHHRPLSTPAWFANTQVMAASDGAKPAAKPPPPPAEDSVWDTDPDEDPAPAEGGGALPASDGPGRPVCEEGASAAADQQAAQQQAALTDEQLMEIFKQTSIFNVRSALANNDALMAPPPGGPPGDDERCEPPKGPIHDGTPRVCVPVQLAERLHLERYKA